METNPDAVFPVPAEGRDEMARQGVRVQRVLPYAGTFSGVDLINEQSGIRSDPQLIGVFFQKAVDQDRKLVDLLDVEVLVVACRRIEYLDIVVLESNVDTVACWRGVEHGQLPGCVRGRMGEYIIRLRCLVFRIQQHDMAVRASDPDIVLAGDAERGVILVILGGEDTELVVFRVILDQVSIHQYPKLVILVELENVDALVCGKGDMPE